MTIDEKEKVKQMREQGLSYATIASILNISINTVKSFCKYHKYKKSNIRDENISYCQNCGKVLTQIEGKKKRDSVVIAADINGGINIEIKPNPKIKHIKSTSVLLVVQNSKFMVILQGNIALMSVI